MPLTLPHRIPIFEKQRSKKCHQSYWSVRRNAFGVVCSTKEDSVYTNICNRPKFLSHRRKSFWRSKHLGGSRNSEQHREKQKTLIAESYTPTKDQHRNWKWWFGKCFSFSRAVFSGSMFIFRCVSGEKLRNQQQSLSMNGNKLIQGVI